MAFTPETAPRNGGRPPGPSIHSKRLDVLSRPVEDYPHFLTLARRLKIPIEPGMTVGDLQAVVHITHDFDGKAAYMRDIIDRTDGPVTQRLAVGGRVDPVSVYVQQMREMTEDAAAASTDAGEGEGGAEG